MQSQNINYLPGLDHLRGFAALLIVCYHGVHLIGYPLRYGEPFAPARLLENWPQTANPIGALIFEGHTAVALFLVLSGFIFTYGSLHKTIIYHRFIINRLLRTYPLFVLLLLTGAFAFPDRFDFTALVQTLLGFGNAQGAMDLGSFSAMFWAIAVEWQFYLVFPLLLIIFRRDGPLLLLGLIAVFILLRSLAWLEGANIRDLAYWTIIGRMDQFLLGMLAAYAYSHGVLLAVRRGVSWLLLLIALGLAIGMLYGFHQAGGWPVSAGWKILWPTLEGLCWAGVILTYLRASQYLPARLSYWLTLPGLISYSLYLLHFSVISVLVKQQWFSTFGLPPTSAALLNTLLWLPLICALATLTYHCVEKPFLQLRLSYHRI